MFKIVRFPDKLNSFFDSLSDNFQFEHFQYFKTLVLLIGFGVGRRNIASLHRHLDPKEWTHRSRFNNFLNVGRFNPEKILEQKAGELLAKLKLKQGDSVYLIIDDSKKGKRGKKMDAVGWVHDPVQGKSVLGHQYVKATLLAKGHTIPFGIRLYVKKSDYKKLGVPFRKTTQLAADLIRAFEAPKGIKVSVLFDSYYLCPTVCAAIRKKGFHFVSTLKSNRNLFKNGRKLKAGAYGKGLFKRKKAKCLSVSKRQGTLTYKYIDAGWLTLNGLGHVHVLYSRKDKKVLGLVTNDPDLKATDIIKTYDLRWNIEVFFKDAKQLLGLGQYQNRSYRAAVTHLHLVCFAYALLTHIAIKGNSAKGEKIKAAKKSTQDLQNELRQIVWKDTANYLKELPDGNTIIEELTRLMIAA